MSMSSSVAYSELTRVLPWSIRACGYPFGTADRAAFLVANAASMSPEVLADIAALGERPAEGPRRTWRDGRLQVDAGGASWLEVGPAVMDYCGAHAGRHDQVACRVVGATEAGLIPGVLLIGADYGLSAMALRIEDGVLRWTLLGWADDGSERPMLSSGEGREALDRSLAGAVEPSDLAESFEGVRLLAWRAPKLIMAAQGPGVEDAQAAVQRAFSRGIAVTPEVLEALYELEKITWAPTSERSRAQAGFQPKPTERQA